MNVRKMVRLHLVQFSAEGEVHERYFRARRDAELFARETGGQVTEVRVPASEVEQLLRVEVRQGE